MIPSEGLEHHSCLFDVPGPKICPREGTVTYLQVYSTTGLGCWSAIWLNSNYPQVYYPNPPRHWPRSTGLVAPPPEISSSTLRICIQRRERLTLNRIQYYSHSFSTLIHNLIIKRPLHRLYQECFLPVSYSTKTRSAKSHSVKSRLAKPGVFPILYV